MGKKLFLLTSYLCLCTVAVCFTPPYLTEPQNQIESISQSQTFRWVTNDELNRHELKIHECEYEKSSVTNSIKLGEYELFREKFVSNLQKSAGLTWAEGYDKPLIVCADEFQQIDGYGSTSLRREVFNRLFGFNTEVKNFKGITHLYNHNHVLIDEAVGKIMYIEFIPQIYANLTYPLIDKYDLNINISNGNEGIEGVAYNQYNNSVYVAKEKSPMALYEFKANPSSSPGSLRQPFNLANAARTWNIKNVSGLFHLSKSSALNGTAASNNLLVLSNESKVLIECDMNGNELSRLSFNNNGANGTLSRAIANAEGIAFGDGFIYILSGAVPENNTTARFYVFENKNYKKSTVNVGNQIFRQSNITGSSYRVANLNYDRNKTYCWNIEGSNIGGEKFQSNFFSFGKTGVAPPPPPPPPPPPVVGPTGINISAPSQGQSFFPKDIMSVRWSFSSNDKVSITLKSDDVNTNREIEAVYSNTGSYNLTVPHAIVSNQYYIEIRSVRDRTVIGRSDKFTIKTKPGISNVKLSNGYLGNTTKYLPGDAITLTWNNGVSGNVIIQLFSDRQWISGFTGSTSNDGIENIKLNPRIPANDELEYRIRVISKVDNRIYAHSEPFKIAYEEAFNFIVPTSTTYNSNSLLKVTWDSKIDNISRVKLLLLQNDEPVKQLTASTTNDGSYSLFGSSLRGIKDGSNYQLFLQSTQNKGLVAFSKYFSFSGGQAKLQQQPDLVISPNPATDFVNVSVKNILNDDTKFRLYNTNGACVKDFILNRENFKLDVSDLAPGFYLMNIINDEYNMNKKLLIE